jgi:hypothetical protein
VSKDQARRHYFSHREFCFTLEGDIFVRYQSFKVACRTPAGCRLLLLLLLLPLPLPCGAGRQRPLQGSLDAAMPAPPRPPPPQDCESLQDAVKAKLPTKIDIGPVYNWDPRDRVKYQKGERWAGSRGCWLAGWLAGCHDGCLRWPAASGPGAASLAGGLPG